MAPIVLAKKTGSKPKSKPTKEKEPQPPPKPVEVPSSDDEEGWEDENSGDESESGEEDDGVDESGFEKLIKALGDDGLNEYDQAHLVALVGGEEESEEGESSGDDDVLALDELEDVELHPDAVPRRDIKVIDNKVCTIRAYGFSSHLSLRMHSKGSRKQSNSTLSCLGQKPSSSHTRGFTQLTTRMT